MLLFKQNDERGVQKVKPFQTFKLESGMSDNILWYKITKISKYIVFYKKDIFGGECNGQLGNGHHHGFATGPSSQLFLVCPGKSVCKMWFF